MAVDDIRHSASHNNNMFGVKVERSCAESLTKKCTIHSGSFMVSRVHDVNNVDEYEDENVPTPFVEDHNGFDFIHANKEPSKSYKFGDDDKSIIDQSLTKLFECMTLAYRLVVFKFLVLSFK